MDAPLSRMTPMEFANQLDRFRHTCPCSLVSGFRTVKRNNVVGGATNSLHLFACAADLVFDTEVELFSAAKIAQSMFGGVELDLTNYHLHVDGRKQTTWHKVRRAGNVYTDLEGFLTNTLL